MRSLTKRELRTMARPNGRDWINVGEYLPVSEEFVVEEKGDLAWYVVMTNPRCEKRAQSGLIDKGFAVYLPQYRLERISPRKGRRVRETINRNLFPRYFFVQAREGAWPRIASTDGVQGLVCNCGRPLTVADQAIDFLLDQQNSGAFDQLLGAEKQPKGRAKKLKAPYVIGEEVMITKGPFRSFFATVERAIAGHTVDVLVWIFGRPTPVCMDIADIEKT